MVSTYHIIVHICGMFLARNDSEYCSPCMYAGPRGSNGSMVEPPTLGAKPITYCLPGTQQCLTEHTDRYIYLRAKENIYV